MPRSGVFVSAIAVLSLSAFCSALAAGSVDAVERRVPPEPGALANAIAEAHPGDVLILLPGRHSGPVVLDRPVTLDGKGKALLEGNGKGSVISVTGKDITVRGLDIRGSGSLHQKVDAGVKLGRSAERTVVESNRSVVFEPITKMTSASSISSSEFVIAPAPKVAPKPATVLAWHNRAEWSMLLVPNTIRANFWRT